MPLVSPVRQDPPAPTWRERLSGGLFYPVAITLIAASVIVFYLVLLTPWREAQTGQSDLSTVAGETALAQAKEQLANMRRRDDQLKAIPANDLERMSTALPEGPATPELLVQLEALMLETAMANAEISIDLTEGKPSEGALKGKVNELVGSFRFETASYQHLKSVVDTIQTNLRLLAVTSVSYDPITSTAVVSFVTYHLP